MGIGQFLYLLVSHLKNSQFSLDKLMIQIKGSVIFVVIIKLLVWYGSVVPNPMGLLFIHTVDSTSVDYRSQSHFPELFNGRLDHSLKSKLKADINRLFLSNIFSSLDKANTISFCISPCHSLDFFLSKGIEKSRHGPFIFCNVFSIFI